MMFHFESMMEDSFLEIRERFFSLEERGGPINGDERRRRERIQRMEKRDKE